MQIGTACSMRVARCSTHLDGFQSVEARDTSLECNAATAIIARGATPRPACAGHILGSAYCTAGRADGRRAGAAGRTGAREPCTCVRLVSHVGSSHVSCSISMLFELCCTESHQDPAPSTIQKHSRTAEVCTHSGAPQHGRPRLASGARGHLPFPW